MLSVIMEHKVLKVLSVQLVLKVQWVIMVLKEIKVLSVILVFKVR